MRHAKFPQWKQHHGMCGWSDRDETHGEDGPTSLSRVHWLSLWLHVQTPAHRRQVFRRRCWNFELCHHQNEYQNSLPEVPLHVTPYSARSPAPLHGQAFNRGIGILLQIIMSTKWGKQKFFARTGQRILQVDCSCLVWKQRDHGNALRYVLKIEEQ